jgi:hypothetical protein
MADISYVIDNADNAATVIEAFALGFVCSRGRLKETPRRSAHTSRLDRHPITCGQNHSPNPKASMSQQPVRPSLLPPDASTYAGDPTALNPTITLPDGTVYAGDPTALNPTITLPDGTVYAGDPTALNPTVGRQPWTTVRADAPLSQLAFVQRESDPAPEV